ncbi:YHS domain-containing (seleno)protein [Algibacter pectinivorans]|uniref:YHS domain-containing protein n=1 Tax=Algibacter pectinivorans TaxID=870482 RepID=A0A1I1MTU3_9FLAO|nr:YHS domain-containing (seleno)protein [Algibacter pectinivorans]SFC86003.1 YHS domain-containing protein [Algibacter pectinivorans]
MKSLIALLILSITTATAQSIDYNLKKGFIANGYDVVAYFNNKAIEGNVKFTTSFDGANYKFSSEDNLKVFKKHPEKYIPEYGGYCAYAIGVKGDKVSINPKTFQIKEEKLYLFYNAWGTNTLELWKKEDENKLREKADKNWQKIKFKK